MKKKGNMKIHTPRQKVIHNSRAHTYPYIFFQVANSVRTWQRCKYGRVSAGTGSILRRIILRLIICGLAPDLTPGRLKE